MLLQVVQAVLAVMEAVALVQMGLVLVLLELQTEAVAEVAWAAILVMVVQEALAL
jgi:hypothetical protein